MHFFASGIVRTLLELGHFALCSCVCCFVENEFQACVVHDQKRFPRNFSWSACDSWYIPFQPEQRGSFRHIFSAYLSGRFRVPIEVSGQVAVVLPRWYTIPECGQGAGSSASAVYEFGLGGAGGGKEGAG